MRIKEAVKSFLLRISPTHRAVTRLKNEQRFLWWLAQVRPGETMTQTKQRVFLAIPPAEGDLRLLQRQGDYMLRRFKQLCEENGLRYFLAAGTLLGAIRHKGFIPWDDDVDVFMPREDFDKLCALLARHDEFFIKTVIIPNGNSINKLFTHKAKFVVKLDIFLMDYADVQETDRDKVKEHILATRREMLSDVKKAQRKGADPAVLAAIREKHMARLPRDAKGKYVYMSIDTCSIAWMAMCPAEDIFPLGTAEFEGETYCVPRRPEILLQAQYGDFMDFPPVIQQAHGTIMKPEKAAEMEQFLRCSAGEETL